MKEFIKYIIPKEASVYDYGENIFTYWIKDGKFSSIIINNNMVYLELDSKTYKTLNKVEICKLLNIIPNIPVKISNNWLIVKKDRKTYTIHISNINKIRSLLK